MANLDATNKNCDYYTVLYGIAVNLEFNKELRLWKLDYFYVELVVVNIFGISLALDVQCVIDAIVKTHKSYRRKQSSYRKKDNSTLSCHTDNLQYRGMVTRASVVCCLNY